MTIGIPSQSQTEGDKFQVAAWQGKTVLFAGIDKQTLETEYGEATVAVVSLVVVLDADDGVVTFTDAFIFGASLAPTLYRSPQDVIVGVLGKGEAKAGKNAPWVLTDPTESTLEAARTWYSKFIVHTDGSDQYYYRPEEAPF